MVQACANHAGRRLHMLVYLGYLGSQLQSSECIDFYPSIELVPVKRYAMSNPTAGIYTPLKTKGMVDRTSCWSYLQSCLHLHLFGLDISLVILTRMQYSITTAEQHNSRLHSYFPVLHCSGSSGLLRHTSEKPNKRRDL